MKPAPFVYDAPATLDETLSLLADRGDEAKILAGGQSLVPLLNFRLARPDRLVDVNGVAELDYLRVDGDRLRIGALTRQSALLASAEVATGWPLLAQGLRFVGHAQIRNRGTVGGSVAHADPAAELPAMLLALDARFHVRSVRGARTLRAEELFVSFLQTALEPDELLVEIEVPLPPPSTRSGFAEFARRHGDFAIGGAAALVTLDADGTCTGAAVTLLAAGATPFRARAAETALTGRRPDPAVLAEAARAAVDGISPVSDLHGSTGYRRDVIAAMTGHALAQAAA